MADILAQIIATKTKEVAAAKGSLPLAAVKTAALSAPPPRSFLNAMTAPGDAPKVIAECKRQSPSRGLMLPNYDPVALALAYQAGGATAISVLTDGPYFGGELAHLWAVHQAVSIPVLRKDFVIDEYQIFEARAHGADTFLLLSGVLSQAQLEAMIAVGRSLGMEPLIESHTEGELSAALATSGRILGINNRDLKSFSIALETGESLVGRALQRSSPPLMVCESGIKGPGDVTRMLAAGYRAFLVGESVATSADPQAAVAALTAARLG